MSFLHGALAALLELDRDVLASFNGSESLFADGLALVLTSAWTWLPLYASLLYLVVKNNEARQVALVAGCVALCLAISDGVADFLAKPLVARPRPLLDPVFGSMVQTVEGFEASGPYGFFSAHASNTFSVALFFSLLVRDRAFGTAMVLWSLLNCWTRLYLGAHYPSDILAGLAWGAVAGGVSYAVWIRAYLGISSGFNYISSRYTSTGYNRSDLDMVLLVLVLTLLYAIIRALVCA